MYSLASLADLVDKLKSKLIDSWIESLRGLAITCPGTGIELLYLSWLWIKGLNVSPQVNTAALGLISHLQWFSWGRGRCNNNTFHSVSSPGWEATVKAVVRRRGICCSWLLHAGIAGPCGITSCWPALPAYVVNTRVYSLICWLASVGFKLRCQTLDLDRHRRQKP